MPGHGVGGPEMPPSDALGGKKGLLVCLFVFPVQTCWVFCDNTSMQSYSDTSN